MEYIFLSDKARGKFDKAIEARAPKRRHFGKQLRKGSRKPPNQLADVYEIIGLRHGMFCPKAPILWSSQALGPIA